MDEQLSGIDKMKLKLKDKFMSNLSTINKENIHKGVFSGINSIITKAAPPDQPDKILPIDGVE